MLHAHQGICEGIQGLLDPADVLPYSENLQATLDRKKDAAAAEPAEDDEDDGTPRPALGSTGPGSGIPTTAPRDCGRLCTCTGAGPKQHVQMTIEDATEFLDTLGFSRFVDQFERTWRGGPRTHLMVPIVTCSLPAALRSWRPAEGLLVDEAEVDRLTLLSDLQKTAVLKRIRVRWPARGKGWPRSARAHAKSLAGMNSR